MKYSAFILLALLLGIHSNAQSIMVSGQCISGTITLTPNGTYNGKTLYQATGSVDTYNGVQVSMYWIDNPDNVWVLDFDGQPYFQNTCNSATPYGTGNAGCPWTVVTGTTCTGANALVISGGVLAVNLSAFTAQKQNNQVLLTWKTATETNNKGFDIEKSRDAINWSSLGFVAGAGNAVVENKYQFIDRSPFVGINYYRLQRQDFDGSKSYSSVVGIDMETSGFYTLVKNPGKGKYQLIIRSAEPVSISLYDLSGRKLFTRLAGMGVQQIDISAYATGTYLLRLSKGNEMQTEKLIKE